jgi:hypothetical protein
MASSLVPFEISSIDEFFPTSTKYDNNYNIGNVQPSHESRPEMEIPHVDGDFDGVDE